MSDLPIYAPLNIEIPAGVASEMQELSPALAGFSILLPESIFFAPPFELVSQIDLDRVSRGDYDIDGHFVPDMRELESASGFSLTEIPGIKASRGQIGYRGWKRGEWVWRKQLLSHVSAIQTFVGSLPFSNIDVVRAMRISPKGVYVPHSDAQNTHLIEAGHVTLTFVISPALKSKALIENALVDLDAPAYFFQDNNPYGIVAKDDESMLMLKVCGFMDAASLRGLFAN